MRLGNCRRLALGSLGGVWFRAIQPQHLATALQTHHSASIKTRFNPGVSAKQPFEILYLAENQQTALYEVQALWGDPSRPLVDPSRTKYWPIDIRVKLQSVADLTDPTQLDLLGVSTQELTGVWNRYLEGDAPTQRLGAALFATKDVEGFLATSARRPENKNLIVFPQKLLKGSELIFEDTSPSGTIHRIGG